MKDKIVTVDATDSIRKACDIYKNKRIGCLIVTENKNVVGIVTERDIIERSICMDKNPNTTPIKEIMTTDVKIVDVDDRINYAVEVLKENNIKKLPVTEKGELIGIVTVTDIAYSRPDIHKFLNSEEQ